MKERLLFPAPEEKPLLKAYGTISEDVQLNVLDNDDPTGNQQFTTTKLHCQLENVETAEKILESKISTNKKSCFLRGVKGIACTTIFTTFSILSFQFDDEYDFLGYVLALSGLLTAFCAVCSVVDCATGMICSRKNAHDDGFLHPDLDKFTQLTQKEVSRVVSILADIKKNTGVVINNIDENSNGNQVISTLNALTNAKRDIRSAVRFGDYLTSSLFKTNHFHGTKAIHNIIVDYVVDPKKPEEEYRGRNRLKFSFK